MVELKLLLVAMHGIIRVEAYAEHRSLCSFRTHPSGSWAGAQGWGCGHRAGALDTQNHRAPTQAQNQSKIPLGIWFSIQSPWLPPGSFPFTHLVAYSGSGTWNQWPQVGEAGLRGGA